MKKFLTLFVLCLLNMSYFCMKFENHLQQVRDTVDQSHMFDFEPVAYLNCNNIAAKNNHLWLACLNTSTKALDFYKQGGLNSSIKGTYPKDCNLGLKTNRDGELFCLTKDKVLYKLAEVDKNSSYTWLELLKEIKMFGIDNNDNLYIVDKENKVKSYDGAKLSDDFGEVEDPCNQLEIHFQKKPVFIFISKNELYQLADKKKSKLAPSISITDVCIDLKLNIIINGVSGVFMKILDEPDFTKVARAIGSQITCGSSRFCTLGFDNYAYCASYDVSDFN